MIPAGTLPPFVAFLDAHNGYPRAAEPARSWRTILMLIPHRQLSPAALRGVVMEFVTRDGTDHSAVEPRIQRVLSQLDAGSAQLHFEETTGTCSIQARQEGEHL